MSNPSLHFTMYADDTTLTTTINPRCRESIGRVNMALNDISKWLNLNKLSLNIRKTKLMILGKKNFKLQFPLEISGTAIEQVSKFKFLGVIIDEQLNWDLHSKSVHGKIARAAGILSRTKNFLPIKIRRTLYNSLVLPHLMYNILNWGSFPKGLDKIQKRCIRQTANVKFNSHTEPICKKLKILKLKDLYQVALLRIAYKFLNKKLPPKFQNMELVVNDAPQNVRGRMHYRLPNYRITKCKNKILFKVPKFLNQLSPELITACRNESLASCVRLLKRKILNEYSDTCSIRNCYICGNISLGQNQMQNNIVRPNRNA